MRPPWQRHSFAAVGLSIDIFDGDPPSEEVDGGVTWLLQERGPVRLGVWVGPGMNLPGWRARFETSQSQFGVEEQTTVCGRQATRQVGDVAPRAATGLVLSPTGDFSHIYESHPARVEVALAFEYASQSILVGWSVEAMERDAWHAAEEHFFASIACANVGAAGSE